MNIANILKTVFYAIQNKFTKNVGLNKNCIHKINN